MPEPSSIGLPEVVLSLVSRDEPGRRWEVERARVTEGLSELYELEIDVLTDETFLDLRALVGQRVTFSLTREDRVRRLHGLVRRSLELERMPDGRWALRLLVVPELWLLAKRRDSRIFPHRDVPRILREVLDAAGLYPGERLRLQLAPAGRDPTHATREYCVQYQETDLDFIRRLLEEEGTTFCFAHELDWGETFVVVDGDLAERDDAFPPVVTRSGGAQVSMISPGQLTLHGDEAVVRFAGQSELRSSSVALHDRDFTRYGRQAALTQDERGPGNPALAVYEHPGRYVPSTLEVPAGQPAEPAVLGLLASLAEGFVAGAAGGRIGGESLRLLDGAAEETLRLLPHAPMPRHTSDTGNRLALVRLQEECCDADVFEGRGNVTGMRAGSWFSLRGHAREDLDQSYLIRRVVHEVHAPDDSRAAEGRAFEQRFLNTFECLPRSTVFRPPRVTPRPRIHGTQTATVVGGPDEEIHVDAYGRVRVQLHWDRQHACQLNALGADAQGAPPERSRDPSLVAWARCAQAWAGPLWGSMFVPRVGMEVVLVFEDGDPDRPLVVGCVYNDVNPPPYDLPSGYHRSTIRTRSIPSTLDPTREGYNELRFDDLAGHEEIFLHAERDLTEVVRNHHETLVGGGQDTEVLMHQTNRVVGSQHESIGGSQTLAVGGMQKVTVAEQRSVEVHGTERHFSGGGRIQESSDFDAGVVRGFHLHYVAPATDASPETDGDVSLVYRAIGRVLDGRRTGRLVDPYSNVEEEREATPGADERARESAPDGGGGDTEQPYVQPLPLETYVVQGNRSKRVAGAEDVVVMSRNTTVATDDQLDVIGRHTTSAGESMSLVVHGVEPDDAKGLSMQTEPSQLDLFMAGQGLRIVPGSLRLRRGKMRLLLDDDGVQLGSESGAVRVHLGEDTTDHGLHVEDDGDTVRLASGQSSEIKVTGDIQLTANGKLVLKAGSARITLENGNVEITGSSITANGVSIGS